ncbi:MAG: LolA family protein [Hyphomicrobiales bacterium]
MLAKAAILIRFTLVFVGTMLAIAVQASAAKSIELTSEQTASIQEISSYINGFTTLQGDFTQISPKGNKSTGIFYISKPGKMRFEYAPPNPFLIVADGTWLTVKNRKKEKGDQYPLSQTPLRLVLNQDVDLIRDAKILAYEEADGLATLTLEDKGDSLSGKLVLVFDRKRQALQQWIIVDSKGRQTTVSLANIVAGIDPDPQLFVVKIDRKQRDSR